MPTRLSKSLKIDPKKLKKAGVYDCLLDFDNRLHVDPALIATCGIKEFSTANVTIINYFNDILRLIKASKKPGDKFWNKALELISTGEGLNNALGYSKEGTGGSGIGPKLGSNTLVSIKTIQTAGIDDPSIFELVGIFEPKIGSDRISDLICFILKDNFCAYTQRIAKELKIASTKTYKIGETKYILPINPFSKDYIILTPSKVLNDLPVADRWDDIPFAAKHNSSLRNKLNVLLLGSWRQFNSMKKEELKEILLSNPDLIKELITLYKKRTRNSYDFSIDHLGDILWDVLGYETGTTQKLDLGVYTPVTASKILDLVKMICQQFKKLIELNGLVNHLYDSNGDRRPERFPQLLFFAIADCYCDANNIDISREVNAGSGALDFKLSRGLAKVNVEIKYSTNGKLVEGYEKQLKLYNSAEGTKHNNSIYLIIKVGDTDSQNSKIKEIQSIIRECNRIKEPCPELIIIDGIIHPTASKR